MKTRVQMALVGLLALVSTTSLAKSVFWIGGHGGNWSETGNWEGGVPASGDRLYITNVTAGVTLALTNDISGLALSAVEFGEGGPVELRGESIELNNYNPWNSYCVVDCYVPMVMKSSSGQWGLTVTATERYNQYGDVEFRNVTKNTIAGKGGPNYSEGQPINFYGTVTCTNTVLAVGAQTYSCTFNGPVVATELQGSNGGDGKFVFKSAGNEISVVKCGYYGNLQFPVAGALKPDTVLEWLTSSTGTESSQYQQRFVYSISADQTVDRISQPTPFEGAVGSRKYYCRLRQKTSGAPSSERTQNTLTMRGTADATAYVEVMDKLALVWDPVDDCTMTFAGAQNTTYGELTVKRGTFKVAEGANFLNVPKLTVSGGATYEVDSAGVAALPALTVLEMTDGSVFKLSEGVDRDPFTAGQVEAVLKGNSKFVLPSGITASFKTLVVNGVMPANKTYTGVGHGGGDVEEVPWIEGAGRVAVSANPTDRVYWKSATGGNWNDPANWYGGAVPGSDKSVYLTVEGGEPYAIAFDANGKLPQKLFVGGAGAAAELVVTATLTGTNTWIEVGENGRITLKENGRIDYCGLGEGGVRTVESLKGSPIRIAAGGEIAIEGGVLDIASMTGFFEIGDGGETPARLTMTAGRFSYALAVVNEDMIRLRKNGRMDFSGGSVTSDLRDVLMTPDGTAGATVRFHGSATWDYPATKSHLLIFGDTSRCLNSPPYPYVEGHTGVLEFDIWNQNRPLDSWLGTDARTPYGIMVGYNSGSARLSVSNAVIGERAEGLTLAMQYNNWQTWTKTDSHAAITGIVEVLSGGVISIDGHGATEPGYSQNTLQGLMVGYGARASAYTKFDGAFRGEMTVKAGGIVTNKTGDTVIGIGYGTGRLAIEGGSLVVCPENGWNYGWSRTFGIGMCGGTGEVVVDGGGSVFAHCDVFVGGVETNRFLSQGSKLAGQNCPVDRHTAQGSLTVRSGTVEFAQNLVVGADGNGVVRMEGDAGSLSVGGNLILSNSVANVESGAELVFVPKGDGISPICVAGETTIRENAKLTVDATAFTPQKWKYRLLSSARMNGSFASAEVKVAAGGEPAEIVVNATGVSLTYPGLRKGTVLIVR